MSHKGQVTKLEERVSIAERVEAGQSSREIAAALNRPLATVRKWRQRYRQKGRAGLSSQMGRPAVGALASASAEMKSALLELRERHPGWGAQTLRLEIARDKRFAGQRIPSRARIAAYLKEQKKVRKYERHQELPEPQARPVQRPHQEWEIDAQGVTTVMGLARCRLSTCWIFTVMSALTAMLVWVSVTPRQNNTSRSCDGPSCATASLNKSVSITIAPFTTTRALLLSRPPSTFG